MRLRPLTEDRPKSVVPVLNRPAIEHTFAYLKQFGIEDIILAMNYLPDVIQDYFGDGSRCGVRLTYCLEKEPLGTAGAVKNAEALLDGTFLVLNGDVFIGLNLAEMLAFHKNKKAKATISLTWVDDPSAFGVVETDDNRKVKRFIEKPPLAEATTHWINAGIYILEPEVLKYVPLDTRCMFERELFPTLLEAGEPIYGYPYRGFWLDMGTPASYFSLNMNFLTSKAQDSLVASLESRKDGIHCGANVDIHPGAVITPPVIIGDGCRISRDVHLTGPVVMGTGCRLGQSAVVVNSILWDNVTIGEHAKVTDCIICSRANIGIKSKILNSIVTSSNTVPLQR